MTNRLALFIAGSLCSAALAQSQDRALHPT
ncbi:MAG: hypothetical protein ACJAYX_003733, partial [Planctomycetota bacterium]